MKITVNEYFNKIEKEESKKPKAQRRYMPSQTEFADAIGVSRQAFNSWLKSPNFRESYIDVIITKMRAYGFDADITDFVEYTPPETQHSE